MPTLVVQDLLPSPVIGRGQVRAAGGEFRGEGWHVRQPRRPGPGDPLGGRPSGLGRTDGQVFLDLLERRGLVHAETLRQELAAEVPYFAPLADGNLGEFGVRLT